MSWRISPLAYAIHVDTESRVFGENTTEVRVDDDTGGEFIVLTQEDRNGEKGVVRLELEELELVLQAARELLRKS